MKTANNKIDKLLGPTGSFAGISMAVFGIVTIIYGSAAMTIVLLIAGSFLAFTYSGTKIDFEKRRLKSYTCLFGFISYGKWIGINEFKKFTISKSRRSYTTYSRANVPLTIKSSDVRLALLNSSGSLKITVNKYDSFESARNAMAELIKELKINHMEEWSS
jgi:hypothetical protein